jgi:hypothetical protein
MIKRLGLIRGLTRGGPLALLLVAGAALAEDKEPLAIFELGAAGEWGLNSGSSSFGPTAAVEFTPIKNRLVIETGVQTEVRFRDIPRCPTRVRNALKRRHRPAHAPRR